MLVASFEAFSGKSSFASRISKDFCSECKLAIRQFELYKEQKVIDAGSSGQFYSARNARIASAVLATAIPSVCPSVCLSNFRPISIVVNRLDASRCHLVWMQASAQGTLCQMENHQPPLPDKGTEPPNFWPVYCGQTAGWIKMSLGMEVDLGVRDIVFDVDPASPEKKHTHSHPISGPCLLWPNGWMDEDSAWYGSRPRLRPHCTRRGPSSRERGTASPPPSFRPMSMCGHGRLSQLLLSSR